ncbi:GLUG motif-containing protein [Segatella copri]|uniref:GLUG motif-containing protein n=1 Tax=Segatella copri TaxID=165179 RepID=UPI00294B0226|nr:GLUG motif-containing protein [Segatella copri]WOG32299.1 hypothetical protein RJT04_01345 [Segatella copri]
MGGAWAQTTKRPAKGNGDVENPFQISTAAELAWFRDYVNEKYENVKASAKLTADIDLSGFCHAADASKNIGNKSWVPIGNSTNKYQGTFDGNNKTITNLYINASQLNVGLFGCTYEGTIKNLTFEYANVTNTNNYVGVLVGKAFWGSTLQNIKISNTCQIKGGNYTGGIAGYLDGNAYNCVNCATVQGIKYIGGLCGFYSISRTGNSMTACANYGNVTASSLGVGGLVGYFDSGTIQDCANYGGVKGTERVAGMAGSVNNGKIQNVFSYGNISVTNKTQNVGMFFGYSYLGATEGMVAYYSGAKLTVNGQEQTVKAFGSGNLSEDSATGFTEAQLKSGVVAYQLQQNASSKAKWGQNLANDDDIYPVIGSEHQVYVDNTTLNCKTNEVVRGSFTNNSTSSAIRYQHGTTIHHAATDATCTEAATKEYWQCQDCQRTYSDSQLTKELTDVTDAEHPALGHDNNEDGYCKRCQHYVAVKPSEQNGVYLIAKPYHLAWFRDYVNGTIVDEGEAAGTTHPSASAMLTADIDLKNYCHAAEDDKELLSWIPIGYVNNSWKGNMDGQGHTISHLYIKTAQSFVGLFGYTYGATIQDLIFDNAKVENVNTTGTNTPYTGILAGYAYGDSPSHIKGIKTTNNCTVIGQEITGGIVGLAKINLENCENHSSVKGTKSVGGIAGFSQEKNIKRCTNYGTVENNNTYIGGIIGYAYGTSIEDCVNYGKISSTGWYTGGIAGQTVANSSIQNVFSYGDVTNTNDNLGIIIGNIVSGTLTAKGIAAYNKEALLNNSSENIKIVGTGSLTFEDGKEEANVVKAFTKQQIKSGEVAYLLNGSTSEGELAWYQKLGTDAYPVLTAAEGNTVYNGSFRYCDNTTSSYSNSSSDSELIHVASATLASPEHDADEHIYHMGCRYEGCTLHKYVADKTGNIEVTKDANNKFVATEDLTLADGEDFKDYEPFISKTISYSRTIPSGSKWGTLCLPFAIDQSQETGCKFYSFTGIDAANECITLESYEGTEIPAGTPVLFKMKEGETSLRLSASNTEITTAPKAGTASDVNLVGSFTKIGGKDNQGLAKTDYIIGKDKFWLVSELDGDNRVGIKPMRAYIHPTNVSQARATMLSIGKGDGTTAIDNLNAISNDANAEYYDANGRRTNGLQKGLNIVKRGSKTYKIMVK